VDRDLAGGLLVDAGQRQVDKRQLEAAGQGARKTLRVATPSSSTACANEPPA
jgi:hypothetical protein